MSNIMQSKSEGKVDTFSCAQPCNNCPYRKDAPLKLWHKSEFEKLLIQEQEQFGSIYNCHKNNGSICIGWLMKQSENNFPCITLRIAMIKKKIDKEYFDRLNSPAPLYKNVKEMIKANYPNLKINP